MCLKKPEVDGNGILLFFYKERIVSVNNCFPKRLLVNRMTFHSSISIIYIL